MSLIITRNWLDRAGVVISPANEEWIVLRDLDDLKLPWGRGLARMHFQFVDIGPEDAGIGAARIHVDLGAQRRIDAVSFIGLNAEDGGTSWGYYIQAVARFSNVAAGGEELGSWAGSWLGEWASELQQSVHVWGTAPIVARYVSIEIDLSRAHGLYVDLHRLVIGEGMRIPEGSDASWSIQMADTAEVEQMRYGGIYTAPGVVTRRLRLGYSTRQAAEAIGWEALTDGRNLLTQLGRAGVASEVIVTPRSLDSGQRRHSHTVWGRLSSFGPLRVGSGNLMDIDELVVEEVAAPPLSTAP